MKLPSWPKATHFFAFTLAYSLFFFSNHPTTAQASDPFPEANLPSPTGLRQSQILPGKSNFYSWSASGWAHETISVFTYDGLGNTTNILLTDANNQPEENLHQQYDSHNNLTLYFRQTLVNNQWQNHSGQRHFYTYTTDGNIAEEIRQEWQNGNWQNKSKQTITYTNQQETERTLSFWHNGNWHFENRQLSTYQNGLLANRISQKFANNTWENEAKFTAYTWDTQQNKITGYTRQAWHNNNWADEFRYTFTYGPNENYERITEENDNGAWVNYNRISGGTDAQGTVYTYRNESWQNGTWQKQTEQQTIRTYDSRQVLTSALAKKWNPATNLLENDHFITFYDFSVISGVNPAAGNSISAVYPNPVQDVLTVSFSETQTGPISIQVVSLTGQVLLKQNIAAGTGQLKIPTEGLTNGLYLLQVQTGNSQQTFRIIKH